MDPRELLRRSTQQNSQRQGQIIQISSKSPIQRVVQQIHVPIIQRVVERIPVQVNQPTHTQFYTQGDSTTRNSSIHRSYGPSCQEQDRVPELEKEIQIWKNKYQMIEINYKDLLSNQTNAQNQIEVLLLENSRLHDQLVKCMQENDDAKNIANDYYNQLQQFQNVKRDLEQTIGLCSQLHQECESWKERCFQFQNQMQGVDQLEFTLKAQEDQIAISQTEINRSKEKCSDLENENKKLRQELKNNNDKMIESSKNNQKENQDKVDSMKREIAKLQNQIDQREQILNQASGLSGQIKDLISENEMLKQKIRQKLNSINQSVLQKEIDRLEQIEEQLKEELDVFKYQFASISSQISKMTELYMTLTICFVEIESLRDRMTTKEGEIETLRKSLIGAYKK